ncbi:unnamed protein product [Cercopithifilaria johnstoni]|uniref:Uncharacterized protein n=1 Tax=Cercopithifilaria johnstoni TaxID=2874296 RepID=A0A8J2M1D4_9BILA|nr:unnamed protein product [Cercopithifilaria johnstoni]
MGDDLLQFFAKKSAKVKDKKKKVKLSVDEVGQVLERKAKRQEERDREDEEERRAQDDAAFFDKRPEDSEWLEYKDTNKEIALEELGIRDMNLTEQAEEALEDEKTATNEAPKTWSTAEKKESEETILPVPKKQTTGVWKPRCLMQNIARTGTVPNINDQDLFPTFEAAEKIEKLKKDDEKKRRNDGFTIVASDRDSSGAWTSRGTSNNNWQRAGSGSSVSSSNADRTALLSAVRQVTSSGAPNPVPPSQPLQTKNPNAYVPPSRRRAQANVTKEMS